MCQTCAQLSTFPTECTFSGSNSGEATNAGSQGMSPHNTWTDQQIADQLTRDGSFWYGDNGNSVIKYSFSSSLGAVWDNFGEYAVDAVQELWIETALDSLADLFGITFQEVSQPSNTDVQSAFDVIQFVNDTGTGTYSSSYLYTSGPNTGGIVANAIVLDQNWDSNQSANLEYGSYGYMTILHEILHSLGLSHPGAYDAGAGVPITYQNDAEFEQDTHRYTVMSYFDSYEDGSGAIFYDIVNDKFVYPRTPMVYDILAMTDGAFAGNFGGYSANATTRNTDTVYGYNATNGIDAAYDFAAHGAPVLTIYDTGGIDTLDLSGDTINQEAFVNYDANGNVVSYGFQARTTTLIDLREGAYSSTHGMTYNIGIAFGTEIENAIGTIFNDTIHGNDLDNSLLGNGGDDTLNGYFGADTLNGGNGVDTLNGGAGDDLLIGGADGDVIDGGTNDLGGDTASYSNSNAAVNVDLGADTASGGHAAGDDLNNIENLFGSRFGDILTGDGGVNLLQGFGGSDTLNGAGGDDTLEGQAGDDTLNGGSGADYLNGGGGIDTADYSDSGVGVDARAGKFGIGGDAQGDFLYSIENITGSDYDDYLVGSNLQNVLNGGEGEDSLLGGNNADTLIGGDGNDILNGGNGADIIDGGLGDGDVASYFSSGGGVRIDLLNGTAGFGQATGDVLSNIESLYGSNGGADRLYGDDGVNVLRGYAGADWLKGNGGDDILSGGNDTDQDRFLYDNANFGADVITDFGDGEDILDMRGLGLSIGDVTATQAGSATILTFAGLTNGEQIRLNNFNAADIDASDFFF